MKQIAIVLGLLAVPALARAADQQQPQQIPVDQAVNSATATILRNTSALGDYVYRLGAQAEAAQAQANALTKQLADLAAENTKLSAEIAKLKPPVAPAVPPAATP